MKSYHLTFLILTYTFELKGIMEGEMAKATKLLFLIAFFVCLLSISAQSAQDETDAILNNSEWSVVTLVAYDSGNREIARGKAVIVSSDGYILTNYHLVCQANSAKVEIPKKTKNIKKVEWENVFAPSVDMERDTGEKKKKPKGKEEDVEGIVAVDKTMNLALLKIKGRGYPSAPISTSDQFNIGDKSLVVIDSESISEGSITNVGVLSETKKIAQISITFPEDMTGSPIFNPEGQLTGVAFSFGEVSNLVFPASYAIPLTENKKVTDFSSYEHENYFATPEGLYIKGLAYALVENYANALGLIEESVRLQPNNPEALSQLGHVYSKMNQYEKAVDAYKQSLNLDPDNYQTSYGLGIAYVRLRKFQEAIDPLKQCTQTNPEFPDGFYNLGLAYQSLDQLEDAAHAFEEFVKINPGPAWTGLNQLGSIYMKLEQYDKAIEAFEEVVKTNSQDIKATYSLAYAYEMSNQYDKAVPLYRKLIQLNPKDAKSYTSMLFRLYDKAGDYENAILVSQEIVDMNPDDAQNHYNLGYAYLKKEDLENALAAFQKALELNPSFDVAYSQIGFVHFKLKQYQEAIDALNKYTEIRPDNPDAFYLIGTSYLQLKKYEQAIQPLVKCIELKEDHAYAHYNLGITYYVLKDRFSANMKVDVLQRLNPELAAKLRNIISR
jgi:tetratricopeptide (TPR) repeat protein